VVTYMGIERFRLTFTSVGDGFAPKYCMYGTSKNAISFFDIFYSFTINSIAFHHGTQTLDIG
jgi:hypothetical protein